MLCSSNYSYPKSHPPTHRKTIDREERQKPIVRKPHTHETLTVWPLSFSIRPDYIIARAVYYDGSVAYIAHIHIRCESSPNSTTENTGSGLLIFFTVSFLRGGTRFFYYRPHTGRIVGRRRSHAVLVVHCRSRRLWNRCRVHNAAVYRLPVCSRASDLRSQFSWIKSLWLLHRRFTLRLSSSISTSLERGSSNAINKR